MLTLRPYQKAALTAIRSSLREHGSTLLVMPTGSGKTVVAGALFREQPGRTLFLVHRDELADQAQRLARAIGCATEREQGPQWADEADLFGLGKSQVVISTVQTQLSRRNGRRRAERFNPREFGLLVVDEGHHAPAASWRHVIRYYREGNPDLRVLGMTATPDRHDEKALGQIFESVAYVYEIEDAVRDGWLVAPRAHRVFVDSLDFSEVRKSAGDLNATDLSRIVEQERNLHAVADTTYRVAGGRKALIFTVSVAQADRLAEILNRHEPGCASCVWAKTPDDERRAIFDAFRRRKFRYLVNVGVATEGYDDPTIEVIVIARPTCSRALYAQMVGRGLRPLAGLLDAVPQEDDQALLGFDGSPESAAGQRRALIANSPKPVCEVLDFVGDSGRHRLASCIDILGGRYTDEELREAERTAQRERGPFDPMAHLSAARRTIEERKKAEAMRRAAVVGRASYRLVNVDVFDVLNIRSVRHYAWQRDGPPTEKQIALLKRWRMETNGLTKRTASQLIDECIRRREAGLCTPKMALYLLRFGYDPDLPMAQAHAILDRIFRRKRRAAE